jgi:cytochrome c oxidase subunit 2
LGTPITQYRCVLNIIALWAGISFQNLAGTLSRFLESLHDLIIVWLVVILMLVSIITALVIFSGYKSIRVIPDSEVLEKTWTLLPIFILFSIALPRIRLLCMQDARCLVPNDTLKVIRNQWNWQRDTHSECYDHLLDADGLDDRRSYEVPLVINSWFRTRVLLTRTDVLHSLGVPSLGVKLDSTPGRLNATIVEVISPGLYVGSCFELCGSGHRVIPLNVLIL